MLSQVSTKSFRIPFPGLRLHSGTLIYEVTKQLVGGKIQNKIQK